MPYYSARSRANLDQCDIRLQRVFEKVLKTYDHSIVQGHRNKVDQNAAYAAGHSKLKWPESKHNHEPSLAVDAAPYPHPPKPSEDYETFLKEWYYFGGYVLGTAAEMGIDIRWGGDWDRDEDFNDQNFDDLYHFEIPG